MKYIIDTDDYAFDVKAIHILVTYERQDSGKTAIFTKSYGIDELDKLKFNGGKTYEDGLEEAWEAAGILSRLCISELRVMFNTIIYGEIFDNFTPQEVIKCVKERGAIRVGDEVVTDNHSVVFWVTSVNEDRVSGIDGEGNPYTYKISEIEWKTGRNNSLIAKLLKNDSE